MFLFVFWCVLFHVSFSLLSLSLICLSLFLSLFLSLPQILLKKGGANNIFSELTKAQFRDARLTIVNAILATDMSGHMQHCADVFQFAQRDKSLRGAAAAAAGGGQRGGGGADAGSGA